MLEDSVVRGDYMRTYRRTQIVTIVALIIAVVTLGVGFAAFSATLNISSSASVSPSSDSFSVGFNATSDGIMGQEQSISPVFGVGAAQGSTVNFRAGDKSLSDLRVYFSEPNQMIQYDLWITNNGELDAYINKFVFNETPVCIAETGASDDLVQDACEGIELVVQLKGMSINSGDNINCVLGKGSSVDISIQIRYKEGSAYADGPFSVDFGNISIESSTVESTSNLILFTVAGVEYQAEEGMTWSEWVNSQYTDGRYQIDDSNVVRLILSDGTCTIGNGGIIYYIYGDDEILSSNYFLSGCSG